MTNIYFDQLMDGVRRRGGKKTSLTPNRSYRYEYTRDHFIAIVNEPENTSRSSIKYTTVMEAEEIG